MLLRIKIVLLFTILTTGYIHGQNLVKNPSLEVFAGKFPEGWHMIAGTPDIASRHFVNADLITRGFYNPFLQRTEHNHVEVIQFGDICLCQGMNHKWSEVTQVELTRPLKRKKQYQVSLYAIKASPDEPPLKEISVYLSRKSLTPAFHPAGYKVAYLPLVSATDSSLSTRSKWIKVKGVYVAQGGERYLTIGNFLGANEAQLKQTLTIQQNEHFEIYYCYDNVSVIPLEETELDTTIPEPIPPVIDTIATVVPQIITLADANFAFGKYDLLESSFETLDKLVNYLKQEPTTNIIISGHTDNVGSKEDNLQLSINRAKSVMSYLLSKGVNAQRIIYKGLGEDNPKESNYSDIGRQKNRRVEIELIKQ